MTTGQAETIAVIGGTGAEGGGLALRWAAAGHRVIIGLRDRSRARQAAGELSALLSSATIEGKILIDVTVPLVPPKVSTVQLPPGGSSVVLVCADDKEARQRVMQLAADAGLRGIDAGPLANSSAAEALTSLLIWINRAYKMPDAGIAITGLP